MAADRLLEAITRYRAAGGPVDRWSVYTTTRRAASLSVKDGLGGGPHTPLNVVEGAGGQYLIVWADGLVSRGSLERRHLAHDASEALVQARDGAYDDPDAAQVLGPQDYPAVALHDPEAARIAGGGADALAERLEFVRELVRRHEIRTWSASFSAADGRGALRTSRGIDVAGEGSTWSWFVSFDGEIGDGFAARRLDDTPAFRRRTERLAELAQALRADAPATGPGTRTVLLHPNVVERYALQTLFRALDGSIVDHREGRFLPEHFGAERATLREDIALTADPLQPLRAGSYRFTAEGVPATKTHFIRDGRLLEPVLDLKYARRLSRRPTALPYSMDTVSFRGGATLGHGEALAAADGGVLVLSVLGVHTQDASSGDFSLSAPQTLLVADGGYAGRLRCTLSGNLFDVLRSDELRFVRFEDETTPGLVFPCRVDPS